MLDEKYKRTHPSFGCVSVNHTNCSKPLPMFGSKTKHMTFITFRVSTAEQHESLHDDLIMSKKRLMEFQMTEAQFLALMSGMNRESVPVTLRHLENGVTLPECPEPVAIVDLQDSNLNDILAEIRKESKEIQSTINEMVAGKKGAGKGALKELQRAVDVLAGRISSNLTYMETTTKERMEKEVAKATREIEAVVNQAAMKLGHQAIDSGTSFEIRPVLGAGRCENCQEYPDGCACIIDMRGL